MEVNTKRSFTEYKVTSPTEDFSLGFEYSEDSQIIDVVLDGKPLSDTGRTSKMINSSTISITPAVDTGILRLSRITDIDKSYYQFTAGAQFIAENMDVNFEQIRHSQQEVRDSFDYLEYHTLGVVEAAKAATDAANDAAADANQAVVDVNNALLGKIMDKHMTIWSGRTQESKNRDLVSMADFGIVSSTTIDQTDKVVEFFNYIRNNKVTGFGIAGDIVVSPKFQRVLGPETMNYAINISGVDFIGTLSGYRNINGTRFHMNSAYAKDGSNHIMLQVGTATDDLTYRIHNIAFRNADQCIRMLYPVHCDIRHIYGDGTVDDVIICGDFNLYSGPLFNVFSDLNGVVNGRPVQFRGQNWCNANIVSNMYMSGAKPSSIHVTSGYGALNNIFLGGEFASRSADGTHGIELGRVSNTAFIGTYFEAHGHAIVFNGVSRQTILDNCTFGTTHLDRCETPVPAFLYHKDGGSVNIEVRGGACFLGSNADQKNMRFLYTDKPSDVTLHMHKNPSVITSNTGYKVFDYDTFRQLRKFSGLYNETVPLPISVNGGSITNMPASSTLQVSVTGNLCTANYRLDKVAGMVFGNGVYYVTLPHISDANPPTVGNLVLFKPNGDRIIGYINPITSTGNTAFNVQDLRVTAKLEADNTITTAARFVRIEVAKAYMDALEVGSYFRCSISYLI